MTLRAQCITTLADLEPWAARWEELHSTVEPALPFTSPRWVLPWLRHFSQSGPLLADELRCWVFSDEAGQLAGIVPLVCSSRPGRGPLRFRELQVAGVDAALTELNVVLCRADRESEVYRALADALGADDLWDQARWWVRESSAFEAGLATQPHVLWEGERPMFILDLPASWETFKSTRSRNIKESLRKGYNSLKREGLTFALRSCSEPDLMPRALDRFFALHRERAQLGGTVAHPDWFASTAAQAFLREVMYRFARRGQARIFELEIEGQVVASRLGFAVGNTLYLYYSGYREAWGRHSVMTTTTAEAIRAAIGEGLAHVNLSFGRDVSKTRWGPREVLYRGAVQTAPRLRSRGFGFLEPRVRSALRSPTLSRLRGLLAHGH